MNFIPCWTCAQPATHTLTRSGSNTLHACDNCTRIDRAEAETRGWTIAPITNTVATRTHFTAWLVNDTSALDQPCMDITVLEDELIGADPEDDSSWSTDTTKPTALYAVTKVDARDGNAEDGCNEAEDLMRNAGWRTIGQWDAVDNAYVVTVERDED